MRARSILASLALLGTLSLVGAGCQKPQPSGEPAAKVAEPQQTNVEIAKVTWPNAGTIDRLALAALPTDARSNVGKSPVPVLVPNDAQLLSTALVSLGDDWYACNTKLEGLTINVQGNRASHAYDDLPKLEGTRSIRTSKGFVTTNEGIEVASWMENGVAYAVDVECADRDDARCLSDDFVLQTAESLKYVGGAGQ